MATSTGNRPAPSKPRRKPVASDFDDPGRAPTPAERRRMDKEQSAPYRESYEAGQKQARAAASKSTGGGRSPGKRPTAAGRRRPPPGALSTRSAVRQLQAPVRAQVTSGLRIVGVSLALVALYDVLVTQEKHPAIFPGVLGSLQKALAWLSAPTPFPTKR